MDHLDYIITMLQKFFWTLNTISNATIKSDYYKTSLSSYFEQHSDSIITSHYTFLHDDCEDFWIADNLS
jgi:hypothetical protein